MTILLSKQHIPLLKESIKFFSSEYEKSKKGIKTNLDSLKEENFLLFPGELMTILKLQQFVDKLENYGEIEISKEEYQKLVIFKDNLSILTKKGESKKGKLIIGKSKLIIWD